MIAHGTFRGFDVINATTKLTKIAKNRGYDIHSYKDVVVMEKIFDIKKKDEFDALPNSIFFYMVHPKKIYLAVEDMDRKTGKICNIQFREDKIKASTMKSLYCQDILESLFYQIVTGNSHKRISERNLKHMTFIMPDKKQAIESEEFLRKLGDAKLQLQELESTVRNDFQKAKNEITI